MSANDKNSNETHKSSAPINIPFASTGPRMGRSRGMSTSSFSSGSPSSPEPATPTMGGTSPRVTIPSPSASPVLSYLMAQSPTKTIPSYSFQKTTFGAPVYEDEEAGKRLPPSAVHAQRASAQFAERYSKPQQPQTLAMPTANHDRSSGPLRRFNTLGPTSTFMSTAAGAPAPVSPTTTSPSTKKARRSTIMGGERPRRAPSPMGERILKGHFDGFN
ncbi:hypothetical protein FISHEDRAFT_70475 [Fistulina hepatica ATCC 64428]|uniref:Uncharacterized protein n=1 Tax=Fistulina hepatica ATCC 64428 TaxID=1128425 RepID=A0A0D7AJ15_9AGAR|nr:hypothetical protein FISHEDRAFT_70475 [Fistulina hepatica ATCC 64428]